MIEPLKTGMKWKNLVMLAVAACVTWTAHAQYAASGADSQCQHNWSPLAIALVPAAEFPDATLDVCGFRWNIFAGRHEDVGGLDIGGVANFTEGETIGLQIAGVYNQIGKSGGSIQVAGIANRCKGGFIGLQTAGVFSCTDNAITGCQISPVSVAGTLEGIQIGVFNRAEGMSGVQIGVVNYAYQASGIQIGVLNIISASPLPILPVVNIGF